jgi:hypothetical protein
MICESIGGKPIWVFYHQDSAQWVSSSSGIALEMLQSHPTVLVRNLEARLFGARRYNTWSASNFILARLVRQGRAEYFDKDSFMLPSV